MGFGRWSDDTYDSISAAYTSKSRDAIFTARSLDLDMSPKGISFRESRDSVEHPHSLAVALFLDVTGSMGSIPEHLVRHKLGTLMNTIISHGLKDAHVLFGGIGDHIADQAPLQIGQFEAETELLNRWLTKLYLEGGGGGQNMESYLLAWLFAARHTSIDCFEKRGVKGFLFTVGDEKTWGEVSDDVLINLMGYGSAESIKAKDILNEAERTYHVFHIHVNTTGYRNNPDVINDWRGLLGERLIICEDANTIPELVASTVAIVNGADLRDVAKNFDHATAASVSKALAKVTKDVTHHGSTSPVIKL